MFTHNWNSDIALSRSSAEIEKSCGLGFFDPDPEVRVSVISNLRLRKDLD